jgi:hypothetical protein
MRRQIEVKTHPAMTMGYAEKGKKMHSAPALQFELQQMEPADVRRHWLEYLM